MIILFLIFLVQFSVACACLAVNKQQQKSIIHKGWNKVGMMEIKSQVRYHREQVNIQWHTALKSSGSCLVSLMVSCMSATGRDVLDRTGVEF